MKKVTILLMVIILFTTGCSSGLLVQASRENNPSKLLNVSTSYFDNYTNEQSDTAYIIKGKVRQENDGNAVALHILADKDVTISVTGKMERKNGGDTKLVYIAPNGAETKVADNSDDTIDTAIKVLQGEGTIKFIGESAVYDFEIQFGLTDGVSYNDSSNILEPTNAASSESDLSTDGWPGEEAENRIISKLYGDDFHRAYSMANIDGTVDGDKFICDYKKLDLTLTDNCILLAQDSGDNTDRTIKYDVDVVYGKCAIKYDNDEGESVVIWSGTGQADGTCTINLGSGANCIRLEALDSDTRLKIKLQCTQ